ncbi:hypothetical protein ACFXJ8_12015 [Nonomuraea sp. NPDC059194]|uniref:hypothetical protein n=1 Tax=Nonomuraea sp. NPDC059194 TaxID=3346764 RepID=UPI003680EB0C
MANQTTAADLPEVEVGRNAAMVTVTTHDGDTVTVTTWTTCPGVGAFVRGFLGQPTSSYEVTLNQP